MECIYVDTVNKVTVMVMWTIMRSDLILLAAVAVGLIWWYMCRCVVLTDVFRDLLCCVACSLLSSCMLVTVISQQHVVI